METNKMNQKIEVQKNIIEQIKKQLEDGSITTEEVDLLLKENSNLVEDSEFLSEIAFLLFIKRRADIICSLVENNMLFNNFDDFLYKNTPIIFYFCNICIYDKSYIKELSAILRSIKNIDYLRKDNNNDILFTKVALLVGTEVLKSIVENNKKLVSKVYDMVNNDGENIVHIAIKEGNKELVMFLIDQFGNKIFHLKNHIDRNPVYYLACKKEEKYVEIFDYILEVLKNDKDYLFGVLNNKDKYFNFNFVAFCVYYENLELLKKIYNFFDYYHFKKLCEVKDNLGRNLLVFSFKMGSTDIFEFLLKNNFFDVTDLYERDGLIGNIINNLEHEDKKEFKKIVDKVFSINTTYSIENNAILLNQRDKDRKTDLIDYAFLGDIEGVKLLINKGESLDEKDNEGKTALMWAAYFNRIEIVKLLIENRAKLDEKDKKGKTALIISAICGNTDVVRLLVEKGCSLDEKDNEGDTALLSSIRCGCSKIAKILIESGANLDEKNQYGKTALILAAYKGNINIAKLLIERGAKLDEKDNEGKTALIWAVENGKLEIVELLIKEGANLDKRDNERNTALILAIYKDYLDVHRNKNYTKIAKLLIEAGANLNVRYNLGKNALIWAVYLNRTEIVKLIIKKIIETEKQIKNEKDIKKYNHEYLNEKDKNGFTALIWAAYLGRLELVELLVKSGAKIDETDNSGKTAIDYAKTDEIKQLLLEKLEKQKQ